MLSNIFLRKNSLCSTLVPLYLPGQTMNCDISLVNKVTVLYIDNKLPLFQIQSILLGWVILEDLKLHSILRSQFCKNLKNSNKNSRQKSRLAFDGVVILATRFVILWIIRDIVQTSEQNKIYYSTRMYSKNVMLLVNWFVKRNKKYINY